MKKAWKLWCIALALCLILSACAAAQPQQAQAEPDAPAEQEMAEEPAAPDYLHHAAYMSAPKGFFEPEQPLRRAEAAQLVCNLAGFTKSAVMDCRYADVSPDAWYYDAVLAACDYFEAPETAEETAQEGNESSKEEASEDSEQAAELTQPEKYFRPNDAALAKELLEAISRALALSDAALPEGMKPLDVLTRADAAQLVNCAIGRSPDKEALQAVSYDLLLDMPREDERYYDVLEAVLPHEYVLDASAEQWNMQSLGLTKPRAGAHTRKGFGFVADDKGCVIRKAGVFTYDGWSYLAADETGRIFADGALHRADGHVFCALRGGQLLTDGARGTYLFDENGYYTTGSEPVDRLLDEAIAACTEEGMTQEEMLKACYDFVRDYKYLGRNPSFDESVKTPPYEKLLEFAEKILSTGKGDCYNFAASFCLLARRLGFEAECIIGECGYVWNWHPIAHGWVEIMQDGQTLLYDPQIENYNIRAGISNEENGAFGVTYETAHARYLKH